MAPSFGEIRQTLSLHEKITKKQRGHDFYPVDGYYAENYFSEFPQWEKKITAFFHQLHSQHQSVGYVDICGRASAKRMGADINYSFDNRDVQGTTTTHIQGDLFSSKEFDAFLKTIEQNGVPPALITFRPMTGLEPYDIIPKEITFETYKSITDAQLEKHLRDALRILRPGGYVLLDRPFQSDGVSDFIQGKRIKDYSLSKDVSQIAKEEGCTLEIQSTLSGPHFLLRKNAPQI